MRLPTSNSPHAQSPLHHGQLADNQIGIHHKPTSTLDLARLHALAAWPCVPTVSIFMPVHAPGPEQAQDPIRLRNLVHEARRQLAVDVDEGHAQAVLDQVEALATSAALRKHANGSIAIFANHTDLVHFFVAEQIAERVIVNGHCYLKPLLPLVDGDGRFYLLELSQHGIKLHLGTRHALAPVVLSNVTEGVDVLRHEPERGTQVRTMGGGGHGAPKYFNASEHEDGKDLIRKYFRQVDAAICSLLHAERAPLVTAGVEYLLPLYWEVSGYAHLIQAGIPHGPWAPGNTLHDRAWSIVSPHFSKASDEAKARFQQLRNTIRTSTDLMEVLRALHQGRVQDLFVSTDAERWGIHDPLTGRIREHASRQPQDEEMLNAALIQGLATRAHVQALPPSLMPAGASIAAVFRY